jgi:hypothetical protein
MYIFFCSAVCSVQFSSVQLEPGRVKVCLLLSGSECRDVGTSALRSSTKQMVATVTIVTLVLVTAIQDV